ncbi:zinc finger protein 652-like [Uranotaenia lowii]|uniref:zinc finger protein 652-like n=1 Tax=Uranotaenia lowii TaxID=190385 RepID=UPI00247B15BB|nr:zinc finger protein 652-like [Uranotaenia lowii]
MPLVFKLERFPNVCRSCLQPKARDELVSLESRLERFQQQRLIDLMDEMTFHIPEEMEYLVPSGICSGCLEQLQEFLDYRQRITCVTKFMLALAHIKNGDTTTMEELFSESDSGLLETLNRLKIVEKSSLELEELLAEFSRYDINSIMNVKKEVGEEECLDFSIMDGSDLKVEIDDGEMIVEYLESAIQKKRRKRKPRHLMFTAKKRGRPRKDLSETDGASPPKPNLEATEVYQEMYGEDSNENVTFDQASNDSDQHEEREVAETMVGPQFQDDSDDDFQLDEALLSESRQRKIREKTGPLQQCPKCKFRTCFSRTFELHMAKHARRALPFCCRRCDIVFESRVELVRHKRSEHRDFICDTCGLSFQQKFGLETHRKRHGNVRQFKCDYCPMEYFTKPEKSLHMKQVHLNAFLANCPHCGLAFKTKSTLNQHLKTHDNQRTHTCAVCGFGFKSYTHLNRHIKAVHQDVRFNCEHCEVSYGRKDKLRMHMEKVHNIQTYFVCEICLQSYPTNKKLDEHKVHHDNPKPLQCGTCLAAHLTQEEFDQHLCISYQENYLCCGRDFKFHFYYNKHMFLEHGMKTNVRVKPKQGVLLGQYRAMRKQAERCPRCGQEFATRNLKKQHMLSCHGTSTVTIGTEQQPDGSQPVVLLDPSTLDTTTEEIVEVSTTTSSALLATIAQPPPVTYEIEYIDQYDGKGTPE